MLPDPRMAQRYLQSAALRGVNNRKQLGRPDMDEDSSSLMIMEEGNKNLFYNCFSPDLWGGLPLERVSLPSQVEGHLHKNMNCKSNAVPMDAQILRETSATSSSGGSMSMSSKGDPKSHNDAENKSEKGQEESAENFKKSSSGTCSSKRSRAAEVHNLSEKRRRNRINEKMKALQNLIPNSNKTDKASMLDEAIDYLKKLQLQVQMLSARSGIDISCVRWLPQMPHLQMQHPAPNACIGRGYGSEARITNSNQPSEGRPSLSGTENQYDGVSVHLPDAAITGWTQTRKPGDLQEWIQSCKIDKQEPSFSLPQSPSATQGIPSAISFRDDKL